MGKRVRNADKGADPVLLLLEWYELLMGAGHGSSPEPDGSRCR
jgi:hypothetical protein